MHGTATAIDMCGLSYTYDIYRKDINIEQEAKNLCEKIMEEMFTSTNTQVKLGFFCRKIIQEC